MINLPLCVQPPGAPTGPQEGFSFFFFFFGWHASTLTTFLATATPPSCPAPVTMAARCSRRTLHKTHTLSPTVSEGSTQAAHTLSPSVALHYYYALFPLLLSLSSRTHRPPATPVCTPHGRKLRRLRTGMGDE